MYCARTGISATPVACDRAAMLCHCPASGGAAQLQHAPIDHAKNIQAGGVRDIEEVPAVGHQIIGRTGQNLAQADVHAGVPQVQRRGRADHWWKRQRGHDPRSPTPTARRERRARPSERPDSGQNPKMATHVRVPGYR